MKIFHIVSSTLLLLGLVSTMFLSACKKDGAEEPVISPDDPSSLSVLSVNKKDINQFEVTFQVKAAAGYTYDDYGLVVSKTAISTLSDGRLYSFGALTHPTYRVDSCLLDSLSAYTVYHMKVFTRSGNTTYLSTDKTISVEELQLQAINNQTIARGATEGPFASRGEIITLETNFTDNTENTKETTAKVGGIDANVVGDYLNYVFLQIPLDLTPGKKPIELHRRGLSLLTSDTLTILSGKYTALNDFPFQYRSLFGSCQAGNTGYMMGGSIYPLSVPAGCYNDMLTYDIDNDKWATSNIAPYPKDWIIQHEIFAINNKIYCIPGRDSMPNTTAFPSSGRIFECDLATNQWIEKKSFPGALRFEPSVFTLNNKAYVFAGDGGGPLSDLWEYTPETDTWVRKADFPGTPVLFPSVFSYKNKAYVFGGTTGSLALQDFWEYDAVTNVWKKLPTNYDVPERYRSVSFVLGSKAYMLGGFSPIVNSMGLDATLNDSWAYDLETQQWSRVSNYTSPDMPPNFTIYYTKPAVFVKDNNAFIYDKGKMMKFTVD